MKFREMRMSVAEPFVDWVLRLETQARFCEFEAEQRNEEFVEALIRRSVPQIASKLYEMSDIFGNNLERITAHGRHLDYIRMEAEEPKPHAKEEGGSGKEEQDGTHEGVIVKPVNAVQISRGGQARRGSYREPRSETDSRNRSQGVTFAGRSGPGAGRFKSNNENCSRCGSVHGPKKCRAYRARCYNCNKEGHFAEFCFSKRNGTNPERGRYDRDETVKSEAVRINQV